MTAAETGQTTRKAYFEQLGRRHRGKNICTATTAGLETFLNSTEAASSNKDGKQRKRKYGLQRRSKASVKPLQGTFAFAEAKSILESAASASDQCSSCFFLRKRTRTKRRKPTRTRGSHRIFGLVETKRKREAHEQTKPAAHTWRARNDANCDHIAPRKRATIKWRQQQV